MTLFNFIKSFKEATLVEAVLLTGRTHQIRVHTQHQGHPIAGDDKYGSFAFNKKMREYGLKRLFLHAHSIEFILPSTGENIKITAPLDTDLIECLDRMQGLNEDNI